MTGFLFFEAQLSDVLILDNPTESKEVTSSQSEMTIMQFLRSPGIFQKSIKTITSRIDLSGEKKEKVGTWAPVSCSLVAHPYLSAQLSWQRNTVIFL